MCMIDSADGWPEFYSKAMRTARAEHKCTECYRTIEPGERYEYVTGKWEGCFCVYKTCRHCVAAREWLVEVCRGFLYQGVYEDLQEHLDCGMNPRWLNLAVSGMRNKWRDKRGTLRREMSLPKQMPEAANVG